jgi:hypothetical protein
MRFAGHAFFGFGLQFMLFAQHPANVMPEVFTFTQKFNVARVPEV